MAEIVNALLALSCCTCGWLASRYHANILNCQLLDTQKSEQIVARAAELLAKFIFQDHLLCLLNIQTPEVAVLKREI